MARSTYIYVVMEGIYPAAAFTVKHELERWLETHSLRQYNVLRLKDNPRSEDKPVMVQ